MAQSFKDATNSLVDTLLVAQCPWVDKSQFQDALLALLAALGAHQFLAVLVNIWFIFASNLILGGMIVPGCQFAPAVPGCPQGPIPAGCFPQIPYVRNFQAVNEFSASLVKNASDNSTTVVPTTGNSDPRAASTNGAVSASLSAVSFAAFLALF